MQALRLDLTRRKFNYQRSQFSVVILLKFFGTDAKIFFLILQLASLLQNVNNIEPTQDFNQRFFSGLFVRLTPIIFVDKGIWKEYDKTHLMFRTEVTK